MKYRCGVCGYIYDEEKEGVRFADLPDDWQCPVCGEGKEGFEPVEEDDVGLAPAPSTVPPTGPPPWRSPGSRTRTFASSLPDSSVRCAQTSEGGAGYSSSPARRSCSARSPTTSNLSRCRRTTKASGPSWT